MKTLSTVTRLNLPRYAANDSDFRFKTELSDNDVNEITVDGNYLNDLFVESGLGVQQVADDLGCSRQTLHSILNGKCPNSEFMPKLLDLLNNNQTNTNSLSDKIRKSRLKKRMTAKEMARLVGCSESEYWSMERGQSRIENVYAVKMSAILDIEIQPDVIITTEKNRNDILISRKQKGLTQKELGELIGVASNSIGSYEHGLINIRYDLAVKLERILDIKLL